MNTIQKLAAFFAVTLVILFSQLIIIPTKAQERCSMEPRTLNSDASSTRVTIRNAYNVERQVVSEVKFYTVGHRGLGQQQYNFDPSSFTANNDGSVSFELPKVNPIAGRTVIEILGGATSDQRFILCTTDPITIQQPTPPPIQRCSISLNQTNRQGTLDPAYPPLAGIPVTAIISDVAFDRYPLGINALLNYYRFWTPTVFPITPDKHWIEIEGRNAGEGASISVRPVGSGGQQGVVELCRIDFTVGGQVTGDVAPLPGTQGGRTTQGPIQFCGAGNLGIQTAIGCIPTTPTEFIAKFLTLAIGIAGGIAFLLILFGGFQVITSTGNPEKLNAGRELVSAAITGLLLILFSVFILRIIGVNILGIPGFG